MRSARLQGQDLNRTSQFVNTLLSKNDVKDLEKPEAPEPPKPSHMVNGGLPFRPDPKTRFSEPPAPPPQQPLPEKPTVPSLKRGPTERPKSGPPEAPSPIRQDSQIVQLTEALNSAKRDIDSQTARMRELETMLQKEREARELAESLAKRLEESANTHINGSAVAPSEPAAEVVEAMKELSVEDDATKDAPAEATVPESDAANETAMALQARIDSMEDQMKDLREQMEQWKQRCEVAESERDADRQTLAEMVAQLRAEEALRAAAQEETRSRSRERQTDTQDEATDDNTDSTSTVTPNAPTIPPADGAGSNDDMSDKPTLSRANTITPMNREKRAMPGQQQVQAGLPYASALGVVLIGMGLMAYLNGWQAPPSRIDR